ncbi:MAG: BamA/TamA family outer membrane protein [Myxococcota bacterium]
MRPRNNRSLDIGGGASTEEGLRVFARFSDRNLFGRALRLQANAKVNLWTEALLAIYEQSIRDQIREFYQAQDVISSSPLLLLEWEVAAGLSYPRIFQLPNFSFGVDLIALRDYDPAFREDSLRLTLISNFDGIRPRLLGRPRRLALQLRFNLERTDLSCNELVTDRENLCSSDLTMVNPGERAEGSNFYFSIIPRVSWDFRDDPLQPRKGFLFELEGESATGIGGESPDFARLEGKLRTWIPISERFTLLFSILGGRIFPLTSSADIPLNRRFYAGGRETIRGYPEQTLIPQDATLRPDREPTNNVSTGGLLYVAAKSELQIEFISPVSLAFFYDIGDLWRLLSDEQLAAEEAANPTGCQNTRVGLSTVCTLGDTEYRRRLAQGAGFGLRLATPIGPLALDFGFPLNYRYSTAETFTIHFSVGSL